MAAQEKVELLREYDITERKVTTKCSDEHMLEIEGFISWRRVGPRLSKINDSDNKQDMNDIEINGKDEADKRRKLITLWEERNGNDATYDDLITAMLKAGKKDEATKVCKLLKSGQHVLWYLLILLRWPRETLAFRVTRLNIVPFSAREIFHFASHFAFSISHFAFSIFHFAFRISLFPLFAFRFSVKCTVSINAHYSPPPGDCRADHGDEFQRCKSRYYIQYLLGEKII